MQFPLNLKIVAFYLLFLSGVAPTFSAWCDESNESYESDRGYRAPAYTDPAVVEEPTPEYADFQNNNEPLNLYNSSTVEGSEGVLLDNDSE